MRELTDFLDGHNFIILRPDPKDPFAENTIHINPIYEEEEDK